MNTFSESLSADSADAAAQFDPAKYWEQRLETYPGLTGVGNTLLGRSYIQWLYRIRQAVFLRLMRSFDFDYRTKSVLDIGSGTGFYLKLWRKLGAHRVRGSDLTEIAVSRLQTDFPDFAIVRLDIGDLLPETLGIGYGIVSAFDVLFHIVDENRYMRALENIHSLLVPEGTFIFSDLLVHGCPVKDDHLVCRTLDQVVRALQKTGFEIVCRVPMFVVMEQPIDSTNKFYRFLWRLMVHVLQRSNVVGFIAGAVLYPVELLLTRVCREGPTTEIVVCRKRPLGIPAQ